MTDYRSIPLDKILIPERLRDVEEDQALAIQASIVEHGLFNPVTVRSTPRAERPYTLVAGAHRCYAMETLEEPEIDAIIVKADADEAQLIEITENLFRNDLSVIDRAVFVQTYRDVWERKHGKVKRGGDQRANLALCLPDVIAQEAEAGFSTHVAERLGMSQRSVKRLNQISQNLHPDVRREVRGTPIADNQSQLLKLAKLEPKVQRKAAVALRKTKGDFAETMNIVDAPDQRKPDRSQQLLSTLISTWDRAGKEVRDEFRKHIAATAKKDRK